MGRVRRTGKTLGAWRAVRASTIIALATLTSACTTMRYLAQAGCGQLDIGLRARPLDGAIHDIATPRHVRDLLAEVPAIKRFAERQGLTPTKNYKRYAEIPRPAVVYVVSASDPLRFKARTW